MRLRIVLALLTFLIMCRSSAFASRLIDRLQAGQSQTVVAYGTSLTAAGAWVGHTQAWLESAYPGKTTFVNSGIGASSSSNINPALSGLSHLGDKVLAFHPDTVFIEFAVNDAYTPYHLTVADSTANLNTMIDRILAANSDCEIILQTMNTVWDDPISNNQALTLRPQLSNYYQGIRDVASARGLLLIDHEPAWAALEQNNVSQFHTYVPDGVHPTGDGSAAITSPQIAAALVPEPTAILLAIPAMALAMARRSVRHDSDPHWCNCAICPAAS